MKTPDYDSLRLQFDALLGMGMSRVRTPWETKLASLIALLKENHPAISWVGAYLERPAGSGTLWVDCYQGKIACLEIPPGRGVCGAAFARRETVIVPNVHAFPGHIACDAAARSEIVVPLYREGKLVGVLDLDSHAPAAFDEADAAGLSLLLRSLDA